jgi:ABC-type nitrate/sulfonate/bicarbonate transport system ATPase subunit
VPAQLQSRDRPASEASDTPSAAHPAGIPAPSEGISLSDVTRTFSDRHGAELRALEGISLRAPRGSVLAVVGPSGCGKTTLLELICGLQQPDSGTIACEPAVLMPQRDLLLPWLSALDNAALALRIAGASRAQARANAGTLFAELGLAGFEQARPHELSGGMRQRVAFLRTLLSGKPVLCLDEPFGALDAITRAQMQGWLVDALRREPRTVVLVTHDVEEAIVLGDRVIVLSPRPGHMVAELDIAMSHPRVRTNPEVLALRGRALVALGQVGPGQDELGRDGLRQDELGRDGLRQDELGRDGLRQVGLGRDGLGQDALGQESGT